MDKNEILKLSRAENAHGDELEKLLKQQRRLKHSYILNMIFVLTFLLLLYAQIHDFLSFNYEFILTLTAILYSFYMLFNSLYEYIHDPDRHPLYLFLASVHAVMAFMFLCTSYLFNFS